MKQASVTPVNAPVKRMPDFCQPRRGVRQTMQAALKSLRALGIDDNLIQIRRIGGGWAYKTIADGGETNTDDTSSTRNSARMESEIRKPVFRVFQADKAVVAQSPAAGTVLTGKDAIILTITAPSAENALPFAMRHSVDGGWGTDRLMPILDTPIAKLEAYIGDAGGFFELREDNPDSAWRWIEQIFQLKPGDLTDQFAYRLARFLPALSRVAGTEEGIALGLHILFGLPLKQLALEATLVPMASGLETRLGTRNGRLGVDAVIGDGVTALARAVVTVGPVTLADYVANDTPVARRYRELLYNLVLPSVVRPPVVESWYVLPPAAGLILGSAEEPVRLALNARFPTVNAQGSL